MTRTRRNVWDVIADPNDKTLLWYARAVGAMQALPIADHRSWRYQAAIHDYIEGEDPLARPGDQMPSPGEQQRFWAQCQHNSWFFLPWHRMYLHHFERIVAARVAALGGPADWALPYWNYSKDAASRLLPDPFREPMLEGNPNPIFVEARAAGANRGEDFADASDAQVVDALSASVFANSQFSGSPGFGGPATGFNHGAGPIGILEGVPHGLMHVAVGGGGGWMGAFNTAALDPIFWLHHANIDRLWDVWLRRDANHRNPSQAFWQSGVRFEFRGLDGNPVQMTAIQVIDSTAQPLDYTYDDLSDPLGVPEAVVGGTLESVSTGSMPEMVGATEAPIELGATTKHAVIPAAFPAPSELEAAEEPKRVYLHLEHLTSDQRAPAYDVYLGVKPNADPTQHPEHRAGRLSTFGVESASRTDGKNAGAGLTVALDVTDLVLRLRTQGKVDPDALGIAFVPVRGSKDAKLRVGRVSLYVK